MQESISRQIENIASKSKTNNIYIIGKGPSIDLVQTDLLTDGIVINLNDSEVIKRGDFCVFSANWVRHSLLKSGFLCGFYLAGKPLPANVSHELLPSIPLEMDHDDLSVHRLEKNQFYDEPLVLLNAIKLALMIAKNVQAEKKWNIYVLGCDFSTGGGQLSTHIRDDFSRSRGRDREAIVSGQVGHFLQFSRYIESKDLANLYHVGNREFSKLGTDAFNKLLRTPERIQLKTEASEDYKVKVIAELTNNHLGDTKRLLEMIRRSKDAGADSIKVQKRHVPTFYSEEQLQSSYYSPFGDTLRDYRQGVELSEEQFLAIDELCRELDISWFCSVLDMPSFELISKFNPNLIKIPSTISNHTEYHKNIANAYKGDVVISTGATTPDYLDHIIGTFGTERKIHLLHCVSAYPTPQEACNIAIVRHYARLSTQYPNIIPGYSSHDIGSAGSVMAVAAGARMVEKHVTLGNVDWIHFDSVAVDLKTDDFRNFVNDIRDAEIIMGSETKEVQPCEHHKYIPNTE